MKNSNLTLLAAFFFCIQSLCAQVNKFDIGIVAGPSLNRLVGNELIEKHYKKAMYFSSGLSFQYNFPKLLSITSGFLYEMKGAVSEMVVTDHTGTPLKTIKFHTNLNYLTVPLMAKFSFGEKFKIFAAGGVYAGYLANSSGGDLLVKSESLTKLDFGALVNVGFSVPIGKKISLALEGRYAYGLKNISTGTNRVEDLNTRSLSVLAGIHFKFGRRSK